MGENLQRTDAPDLEFTGERMIPECSDATTFWEHIYRYRLAAKYVQGKRVLDIACGEGYGSASLAASGAAHVLGVDISQEACDHATARYGIETRVGSAEDIPLESKSVDVLVSFETIEHVPHPARMIEECARVVRPGGLIVISTPNRDVYSPENQYHCSEMNEAEFLAMLRPHVASYTLFSQRPRETKWLTARSFSAQGSRWERLRGRGKVDSLLNRLFMPETLGLSFDAARHDPVRVILARDRLFSRIANHYDVWPRSVSSGEVPAYIIAVARV